MIAAGAAAHSDHGRRPALLLREVAEGHNTDYAITDIDKLKSVAIRLGVYKEGDSIKEIAGKIADVALESFQDRRKDVSLLLFHICLKNVCSALLTWRRDL